MNYYTNPQMVHGCQAVRKPEIKKPEPPMPPIPPMPSRGPLAMAQFPWQSFEEIYPEDLALSKGTIFGQLDLPFKGCRH